MIHSFFLAERATNLDFVIKDSLKDLGLPIYFFPVSFLLQNKLIFISVLCTFASQSKQKTKDRRQKLKTSNLVDVMNKAHIDAASSVSLKSLKTTNRTLGYIFLSVAGQELLTCHMPKAATE